MEAIKQHFLDMENLQECWYNDAFEMIHYNHPAYPNHISRAEALQIKDAKPAKAEKETTSSKEKNDK